MGNFNGFNTYDIENTRRPRLIASIVCPGGQGDVSVHGNLLFMSVEQTRGRIDCGTQGVVETASKERFRGIRIFDISDLRKPKQLAAIQTCRGSHTHTLVVRSEGQGQHLRLRPGYGRGAPGRRAGRLLWRRSEGEPEHGALQHRHHQGAAGHAGKGGHRQSPAHLRGSRAPATSPGCGRAAITAPARSGPRSRISATTSRCSLRSAWRPAPARATASCSTSRIR